MPNLLEHLDVIKAALRRSPFGLMTDVDGTISETAPTPQDATVSPLCRHYLSVLVERLALVAAISGRAATETRNLVGADGIIYFGNHGMERYDEGDLRPNQNDEDYTGVINRTIRELAPLLTRPGIMIENKGFSATIHYRLCSDHRAARQEIRAALEAFTRAGQIKTPSGKMSINLLPPVEINKGTAVQKLIQEYGLQGGLYLGDDITDINAFIAIHAASRNSNFQGFAIGVASREMPKKLLAETDFTLNGLKDVELFLEWLSQTAHPAG